jgi:hypothetical protein
MKISAVCLAVAGALAIGSIASVAAAELPKDARKQIKSQFVGKTVYARIDLPHKSGRHAWGTYKAPLVEVTPAGHNTDA